MKIAELQREQEERVRPAMPQIGRVESFKRVQSLDNLAPSPQLYRAAFLQVEEQQKPARPVRQSNLK